MKLKLERELNNWKYAKFGEQIPLIEIYNIKFRLRQGKDIFVRDSVITVRIEIKGIQNKETKGKILIDN